VLVHSIQEVIDNYLRFNPMSGQEIVDVGDKMILVYGGMTARFMNEFQFQGGWDTHWRIQKIELIDGVIDPKKINYGFFAFKLTTRLSA